MLVAGTLRDSLVLIDAMHDQDGGVPPQMIMTDTASYSDVVFGLLRLLGRLAWPGCPTRGPGGARLWATARGRLVVGRCRRPATLTDQRTATVLPCSPPNSLAWPWTTAYSRRPAAAGKSVSSLDEGLRAQPASLELGPDGGAEHRQLVARDTKNLSRPVFDDSSAHQLSQGRNALIGALGRKMAVNQSQTAPAVGHPHLVGLGDDVQPLASAQRPRSASEPDFGLDDATTSVCPRR